MLNEDTLNALPEAICQRLDKLNTEYLERIGQKVKEIGEMSPGDLRRLQRMQTYGADIEAELERITEKNAREIYEIVDAVAKDIYTSAAPAYTAKGIEYISYAKNEELQRYVESIARQTVREYVNLTQNTAFCVWGAPGETSPSIFAENRKKIPTSLSETYTRVIDEAVTAAQTGMTDYNTAIRSTLRTLSDSGIRTVDYATGYSRRLDTAVRQNVLWGIKQCAQGVSEQVGEEIGADGWEISYHSNPRPSHEAMGGRMYAAGSRGVTIDGRYYPPFSDVDDLLEEYNCLHYKFPVLLGISEPTYDDDELAAMKANDRRTFEFEGKEYTGYEATQVQRKLETEMRRQKDRANLFAASGDEDGRRAAQEKINLLTRKYKQFSDAAGLPTKKERMSVAKFHSVKTAAELKRSNNLRLATATNSSESHQASKKVKSIRVPDFDDKANAEINRKHQELLDYAIKENDGDECSFILSEDLTNIAKQKGRHTQLDFTSAECVDMLTNQSNLFVMHTHPNNSSYSNLDLAFFIQHDAVRHLSIVKSNGEIEVLTKPVTYDSIKARNEFRRTYKAYAGKGSQIELGTVVKEFLKKCQKKNLLQLTKS